MRSPIGSLAARLRKERRLLNSHPKVTHWLTFPLAPTSRIRQQKQDSALVQLARFLSAWRR